MLLNLGSLTKLRVSRDRCQPFEITGFPPDFNSLLSLKYAGRLGEPQSRNCNKANRRTLLQRIGKRSSTLDPPEIRRRPERKKVQKIKDRLEALLFAETLQGTLSPNANPGKGSIGGLLNLMPRAPARIQRKAQRHRFTCPRLDLLYQSERDCARGE